MNTNPSEMPATRAQTIFSVLLSIKLSIESVVSHDDVERFASQERGKDLGRTLPRLPRRKTFFDICRVRIDRFIGDWLVKGSFRWHVMCVNWHA